MPTEKELRQFVKRNKKVFADIEHHIFMCDDKRDLRVLACCLASSLKRIMDSCMDEGQIDTVLTYLIKNQSTIEKKKV